MVYMIKHSIIHAIASSGGASMTRGLAIVFLAATVAGHACNRHNSNRGRRNRNL